MTQEHITGLTAQSVFPPGAGPEPGSVHESYVNDRLEEIGAWGEETFSELARRHALERSEKVAYTDGRLSLTWAELDRITDQYASMFVALGVRRGDRIGVLYPDGPVVHALYLATERAGLTAVGIGPRAGAVEVEHLLSLTGAVGLVTAHEHAGGSVTELVQRLRSAIPDLRHHVVIDDGTASVVSINGKAVDDGWLGDLPPVDRELAMGLGEVFLLNSTSGTTGMPKCVVHNQNRWLYFAQQALNSAEISSDDVILGLVPAPYGFGIWTAHALPILLGATTVVPPKFDADAATRLIETHQATVMAAVTTQFIKMLNSDAMKHTDPTSLRVMYTGGEAIPYQRIVEFEERTGAVVLNFYGSNETGLLSYTVEQDPEARRRRTGGRVDTRMNVVLLDPDGNEVIGQPGRSACQGPATSLGYYADIEANAQLFTEAGQMLTGDLCEIDDDGYLRVVGRTSSFIIRGGKNISEAAVEEAVGAHPSVAICAAVGVPDPVYGERVRAIVELHPGASLGLEELKAFLADEEISKELWPEQLEIMERIPLASGEKVAKGELRKQIQEEFGQI